MSVRLTAGIARRHAGHHDEQYGWRSTLRRFQARSAVGVRPIVPTLGNVAQEFIADQAASDAEVEGVANQFGAYVPGHRMPDDLEGVQVDDRGQVETPCWAGR
jgi:hypothetical protein